MSNFEDQLDRIEKKLDKIGEWRSEFEVRIDRAEQFIASATWLVRAAIGAAVTAGVSGLIFLFVFLARATSVGAHP